MIWKVKVQVVSTIDCFKRQIDVRILHCSVRQKQITKLMNQFGFHLKISMNKNDNFAFDKLKYTH